MTVPLFLKLVRIILTLKILVGWLYHNVNKDLLSPVLNKMRFGGMTTDNLECLVGY